MADKIGAVLMGVGLMMFVSGSVVLLLQDVVKEVLK